MHKSSSEVKKSQRKILPEDYKERRKECSKAKGIKSGRRKDRRVLEI
jgi:hypothetical protein